MPRKHRLALLAVCAVLAAATGASAHTRVFAEARLDVMVNADGTVGSLRNLWRFDDLFSSTVMTEFDKNADLKLDEAELGEVSQTIFDSLAEYRYFQLVTQDGKDVPMNPPAQLMTEFQDNQLIVLFESTPKAPLKLAGKVDFGIYDPTFYTAIDFTEDDHMAVQGLPAACTHKVVRPDPDEAIAQNQNALTEAFLNDPTGTKLGKIFATKLELDCKATR